MSELERINQSVNASISILTRTLELYDKVKRNEKLDANELINILKDVDEKKGDLRWIYDQLKEVTTNPFHLKFIKIPVERHGTEMAVRLMDAIEKTAPGKPFPSAQTMIDTLGIENVDNQTHFAKGYQQTVAALESHHASPVTKSINIWFWICMSLFGTVAFVIVLWVSRKLLALYRKFRVRWVGKSRGKRSRRSSNKRKGSRKFKPSLTLPLIQPVDQQFPEGTLSS